MNLADLDRWLTGADDPPHVVLSDLLTTAAERQSRGSPNYYRAFPPHESKALREHHRRTLPAWAQGSGFDGGEARLVNAAGTLVSRGWTRIVVGDYGAFVEFSLARAARENFSIGSGGEAYNWLRTLDRAQTKIYEQLRRVTYADYLPGYFYVDPQDVRTRG